MTSSDPTRDPGTDVDALPEAPNADATAGTDVDSTTDSDAGSATDTGDTGRSTELVPHEEGGSVVDPKTSVQSYDDPAAGTHRPARPEVNRQTRIGAAWVAVAVGVIVLVLLLIFILQNLQSVTVTYFSAHGTLPLGVLLLFAAAGGALLVIILGFARMLQMRLLARRDRKSLH